MTFDLSQIESEILQLLAIVIGSGVIWLLKQVLAWLGIKLSAEQNTQLETAVNKGMTLGVTQANAMIKARGWDHVDSKNAVINFALPIVETKFQDTLKASGIDLSDPSDRQKLIDMMERMWPDVATRLAISPATPPAPPTSVVAVSPPTPHVF